MLILDYSSIKSDYAESNGNCRNTQGLFSPFAVENLHWMSSGLGGLGYAAARLACWQEQLKVAPFGARR